MAKAKVVSFPHGKGFKKPELTRDPVMSLVLNAIKTSGINTTEICKRSKIAPSTLRNWQENITRRPQYFTVNAVMQALGYENDWKKK